MFDQRPIKETLVSPLQRAKSDVFFDIVLFTPKVLQHPCELSILSADRRREKAAQAETFAFLPGESRRFVVARIVEKRAACELFFGLIHGAVCGAGPSRSQSVTLHGSRKSALASSLPPARVSSSHRTGTVLSVSAPRPRPRAPIVVQDAGSEATRHWVQITLLLMLLGALVFSGYWWKQQRGANQEAPSYDLILATEHVD